MDVGIAMFATAYAIDPITLGREVEARGFDSLWIPEHTHIPVSRRSPWPGGAQLPREYTSCYDPFLTLAAVAAVTTRLLLGTGVCLVVQRDPIVTAKEVATLDQLSGGRVIVGVGGGWNREEMENHGTDPGRRWKLLRERVEAMRELWTHDEAEYHGEFVDFDPVWQWPKPVQTPHPPVHVGGSGPTTLKRVVRYGDGWMPLGRGEDIDFAGKIIELNDLLSAAGREPVPVSVFSPPSDLGHLQTLAAAGVDRVILQVPSKPRDDLMPILDRYAQTATQLE